MAAPLLTHHPIVTPLLTHSLLLQMFTNGAHTHLNQVRLWLASFNTPKNRHSINHDSYPKSKPNPNPNHNLDLNLNSDANPNPNPNPNRDPKHNPDSNRNTGAVCDTYFYSARDSQQTDLLKNFARRNTASTAELLAEFYSYYSWEFDFRRQSVSVRTGCPIRKIVR